MDTDIKNLTMEDLVYLIQEIGGEKIKQYFKKNPAGFSYIKPDCQIKNLSPTEALGVALKNIDAPYIRGLILHMLNLWIVDIKYKQKGLLKRSYNPKESLLSVLTNSPFADNIGLYFKITNQELPQNHNNNVPMSSNENLMTDQLQSTSEGQNDEAELLSKRFKEQQMEVEKLKTQRNSLQQKLEVKERILAEQTEKLREYEAKQVEYKNLVDRKETEIARLKENNPEDAALLSESEFPYTSVCRVINNENKNSSRLLRAADIEYGMILDDYLIGSPTRRYLYCSTTLNKGEFGVWEWKAEPNISDPQKTYVTGYQTDKYKLTQVIWTSASSIKELKELLVKGLKSKVEIAGQYILFAIEKSRTEATAIRCDKNQLIRENGTYILKSNVYTLPVYKIFKQMIKPLDLINFYQKLNLGTPESFIQVIDPLETVKNLLLDRITWSKMKTEELSRKEFQAIKQIVEDMKVDDFYDEVSEKCRCSREEAEKLVDEFIQKSSGHFTGQDISTGIMEQVIKNNDSLKEQLYKTAEAKWQEEHANEIAKETLALQTLQEQAKQVKENMDTLREENTQLHEKYDALQSAYQEKEKLSAAVEQKVKERIMAAKNNAADFIADLLLKSGIQNRKTSGNSIFTIYQNGKRFNGTPKVYRTYEEFLKNLEDQLYTCGISESYIESFAAYLYAAFVNRIPLILAGPNGLAIAKAFSLAMENRNPGIMNLEGGLNRDALENCMKGDNQIILVNNPFNPSWASYLPSILESKDKFILLNVPYAEDLQLVSRDILHMALPVFTSFLVEEKESGEYQGGEWEPHAVIYTPQETDESFSREMKTVEKSLGIISVSKSMLHEILTDFHTLYNGGDANTMDWLYAVFPYAYTVNRLDKILDLAPHDANTAQISAAWKNLYGKDEI